MLFEVFIQTAHLRRDVFIEVMFEFINVLILPVMWIMYCAIYCLGLHRSAHFVSDVNCVLCDLASCLHRSAIEVKPTMHDLIVEAIRKYAHDFDC